MNGMRRWFRGGLGSGVRDEVRERLDRQAARLSAVENDLARIGPQVAALEARVEDLKELLTRVELPEGDRAEAISVLEEMRREHAQVRARITAATRYEERLRRVEERLDGR